VQAAAGGLADLNVPDHMFQEHNMAGGGIVAFDEGGHVPGYAGNTDGSLVGGTSNDFALNQYLARRAQIEKELARLSGTPAGQLEEDRAAFAQTFGAPGRFARNTYTGIAAGLGNLEGRVRNLLSGKPEYKTNIDYGRESAPASKAQALTEELANINNAIGQIQKQSGLPAAEQKPQAAPPVPTRPRAPSLGGEVSPYKIDTFTPTEIPKTQAEAELEEAQKLAGKDKAEFMESKKKEREAAGIKDVYGQQFSDIVAEKNKLAEDKATSAWMAALEAGLSITAGDSPYALKNLGVGALKGISSYKDALKEIKQNEKDLRKEGNALERDQQNMLEARVRGDNAEYQTAFDRVQGRRDKIQSIDAQNIVLKNSADQYNVGQKTEANKFSAQQTQENRRAQAQINAHIQAAQISADASTKAAIARILAGQQLNPLEKGKLDKLAEEAYLAYAQDPANKNKTLIPREAYKQNYIATMGGSGGSGYTPSGSLIPGKAGVSRYSLTEE